MVFKECDLDGDSRINFDEFCSAGYDSQKIDTKNIQTMFNMININKNKAIQSEDFERFMPTQNNLWSSIISNASN